MIPVITDERPSELSARIHPTVRVGIRYVDSFETGIILIRKEMADYAYLMGLVVVASYRDYPIIPLEGDLAITFKCRRESVGDKRVSLCYRVERGAGELKGYEATTIEEAVKLNQEMIDRELPKHLKDPL